ncbi:MAG: Hsp33 family molecular chaperone HslO [Methylotenera sp.]|nr:Hsp33 family molecular chaperone HslO [Methylotenera sp.]
MTTFTHTDQLKRFIFENSAVRGNHIQLESTIQEALAHHAYPLVLRNALSQLMVASALLAATLKMQGSLVLQIQGRGKLKLLVVECTAQLEMRATAKWSGEIADESFIELLALGQFVITLDPKDGKQTYQGIVPIEGQSIAEILQNYMQRSEQIETRIWLSNNSTRAAGMLLQKLPEQLEQDADAWNRICHLADTVTENELLDLDAESLLYRLFHEENVRVFEAQTARFKCSCSRQNVGNMLRMLGAEEIHSILAELGKIEVHCDFCNTAYAFDAVDATQLLTTETIITASAVAH